MQNLMKMNKIKVKSQELLSRFLCKINEALTRICVYETLCPQPYIFAPKEGSS